MFESGPNRWRTFDAWPPREAQTKTLYFRPAGGLGFSPPTDGANERRRAGVNFEFDQFISDPAHPVPYTTGTDADWVVKIIDVYPDDTPDNPRTLPNVHLGGYQQLVRSEVMRGRFRNSSEKPEPFVANQVTAVPFTVQDLCHTFRKGHWLLVQVQSTWFPLVDRNPQQYVPNIFAADAAHFQSATHRLYHSPAPASQLVLKVLP